MLVVTGTALTKNTPAAVLRKLGRAGPNSSALEEPAGPTESLKEDGRRSVLEARANPDFDHHDHE